MNKSTRPPRGNYLAFIAVNESISYQKVRAVSQLGYFDQSRLCRDGELRDVTVSVTGEYLGEGKVTSTLAEELSDAEQDRLCGTGGE